MSAGPPQYGTDPWAELEYPRGLALLVFAAAENGTSHVIGFAASGEQTPDEVLAAAHRAAARLRGVVVLVPMLADYRET